MHQYATLEDTVYFGFGANLTSGAAGDGATPLFDVRLGGGAAGDAPILSGTPTLLTHANYSDGCYEVAVAATAANGFAAGNTYLVFVTLTIDSVTPAACIGSFRLAPVPANTTQVGGTTQTAGDIYAQIGVAGAGLTAINAALLDYANGVELGVTLRQAIRLILSAAAGKTNGFVPGSDGMGRIRDIGDTKDRIVATYDGNGNRTSITTDVS